MGSLCTPHLSPSIISQRVIQPSSLKQIQNKNKNQTNLQQNLQLQLTSNNNQSVYSPQIIPQQVIRLPDGSQYHGSTKNGVPHGNGIQYHENKDKYTGQFVQGMKSGHGKYQYANGVVYVGYFKKGEIDGFGKMQWPNGDWYQGQFQGSIINGYGRYYSKNNNSYYEGTYLDGKKHGKGKITTNKQVLNGYWELGQFKYQKVVRYEPI